MVHTTSDILSRLDAKLALLVGRIEQSSMYETFTNPDTDFSLVVAIMKNIMLETYSYGRYVTEATATAIGRLGDDRHGLIHPLMEHLLSEVGHPELALQAYVELGGDEAAARSSRPSPAAFGVGAVCRQLAQTESPFSYLGYMYLLEGSTAVVAPRFHQILERIGKPLRFITVHAEEDTDHVDYLGSLIRKISHNYPEAGPTIEFSFDCFASVYPAPVWAEALHRATEESYAVSKAV